ncbi:MAG: hypothetical protein HQ507_11475 [Candidatus Marinimicrobia bacterium]|nr:hypothetical protein [Candidatus Neomarinimicrobiota bacterium]
MNKLTDFKARLFFTYLKDKTELLLYVKPQGTSGSEMIYRRSPGDAAMNLRIQAVLDNAGVNRSNTEIWIMLYPPEIHTTTMYIPSHASGQEVRELIHEQIFANLPYPIHYDWENYSLRVHDNGNNENMITVTILGKDVLPRIRELLHDNYKRVTFIGDGLQFLNVDSAFLGFARNKTYEMILPYDEVFYLAAFRSGIHVESSVLTHACSSHFGDYQLNPQQVYLDFRHEEGLMDQPQIQPVVPLKAWKEVLLTPAAFPSWFISNNSLNQQSQVNFAETAVYQNRSEQKEDLPRNYQVDRMLN